MKRTDQERIDRELRRTRKKEEIAGKLSDRKEQNAGGFATALAERLMHDEHEVFNTAEDEDLLEVILDMKDVLPEKQWESVLRKAIRITKVEQKNEAFERLQPLLEM